MSTYGGGRHEHGQNFLTDTSTLERISTLVAQTPGPLVEIGPGQGNLTQRLASLQRPLTVVEIDTGLAHSLHAALRPAVTVVNADFLKWSLPDCNHVVAGNLPFHLTTAILRKLLHERTWSAAVLLVQWEVARRRAGVGGASMMTAQWWPWVHFTLHGKVPRSAFRPSPDVDGGLITMAPRMQPLLDPSQQQPYRQFVHRMFTGKARGMSNILSLATQVTTREVIRRWLAEAGVTEAALARDLTAEQWAFLFSRAQEMTPQRKQRRRWRV